MVSNQSNMGTLAAKMKDLKDLDNENIVKVITKKNLNNQEFSEANNFLRRSSRNRKYLSSYRNLLLFN